MTSHQPLACEAASAAKDKSVEGSVSKARVNYPEDSASDEQMAKVFDHLAEVDSTMRRPLLKPPRKDHPGEANEKKVGASVDDDEEPG